MHDPESASAEPPASPSRPALAQLEATREALQMQVNQLERQLARLSHDLRNPLGAIRLGTELLRRGVLDPQQRQVLDHIDSAGERAQQLIDQRIAEAQTATRGDERPRPVALHALVAQCVETLAQAFPGHALEHDRLGEGHCQADPDRLAQLVGRMVAEAAAVATPGSGLIVASIVEPERFRIAVHAPTPPEGEVQDGGGEDRLRDAVRAQGGRLEVMRQTAPSGRTLVASFARGAPMAT